MIRLLGIVFCFQDYTFPWITPSQHMALWLAGWCSVHALVTVCMRSYTLGHKLCNWGYNTSVSNLHCCSNSSPWYNIYIYARTWLCMTSYRWHPVSLAMETGWMPGPFGVVGCTSCICINAQINCLLISVSGHLPLLSLLPNNTAAIVTDDEVYKVTCNLWT